MLARTAAAPARLAACLGARDGACRQGEARRGCGDDNRLQVHHQIERLSFAQVLNAFRHLGKGDAAPNGRLLDPALFLVIESQDAHSVQAHPASTTVYQPLLALAHVQNGIDLPGPAFDGFI